MDTDNTRRIDDYLNASMRPEARQQFEQELNLNQDLAKAFELQKEIQKSVVLSQNDALKAKLQSMHAGSTNTAEPPRSIIPMRNWLSIAAGIAILAAAALWLFNSGEEASDLYEAYYTKYDYKVGTRNGDVSKSLIQAEALYQESQYSKAVEAFKQAEQDAQVDDASRIAWANALMQSGQWLQAEDQLAKVKTSLYMDQRDWYQIMIFLAQEKKEQAKLLLQASAADRDNDYAEDAKKLLKALP